jgi:predicted RND superfamily exporter protein
MLMLGMGTEALIFFMSAWEKPPKDYKWERAYPGILDAEDSNPDDVTVTQQLDKMLEDVNVDSKVIKSLGDLADGTKKYNSQMLSASDNLEKINDLYMEQIKSSEQQFMATQKMTSNLTSSLDQTARLHVELQTLSENLNALNNVYGGMLNAMTNTKKK